MKEKLVLPLLGHAARGASSLCCWAGCCDVAAALSRFALQHGVRHRSSPIAPTLCSVRGGGSAPYRERIGLPCRRGSSSGDEGC